jgi:hypothetical protein
MRVDDASLQLSVVQRPRAFQAQYRMGNVELIGGPFQVTAKCTVHRGGATGPVAGRGPVNPRSAAWKLGFMQVRVLETNWAYYKGAQPQAGSALFDKAVGQRLGICRDYDSSSGHVWYEGSGNPADCYGVPDPSKTPPWRLEFHFGDNPKNDVPGAIANGNTSLHNYLDEARVALAFVTTVTELRNGAFHHLRHFMWSMIWHIKSATGPAGAGRGPYTLIKDSGFWVSEFKRGAPTDPRYRSVLDNAALTNSCNDVVQSVMPSKQFDSGWGSFPVMTRQDRLF